MRCVLAGAHSEAFNGMHLSLSDGTQSTSPHCSRCLSERWLRRISNRSPLRQRAGTLIGSTARDEEEETHQPSPAFILAPALMSYVCHTDGGPGVCWPRSGNSTCCVRWSPAVSRVETGVAVETTPPAGDRRRGKDTPAEEKVVCQIGCSLKLITEIQEQRRY